MAQARCNVACWQCSFIVYMIDISRCLEQPNGATNESPRQLDKIPWLEACRGIPTTHKDVFEMDSAKVLLSRSSKIFLDINNGDCITRLYERSRIAHHPGFITRYRF